MNKTLKAWLLGYVVFRVQNDEGTRYFATYSRAHRATHEQTGDVSFCGLHIWPPFGWLGFFVRWAP